MEQTIPIPLGDKNDSETDYRDQLPVNYTLVERNIKGATGYILSHSGLSAFGNLTDIDRGAFFNDRLNEHLRISGTKLRKVSTSGSSTFIGNISGSDHVITPYSFQTQGILANNRFWLYDGQLLTEVTDPDLGSPIDCIWVDGVYFFTDGETLYHTRADSETSIDPLTFATSEFSPDRTWGLLKNKQNQVVVLNRYSTEWFTDTGAATNFRFLRIAGKSVKVGIVGTNCKVEMDGQIFVLGGRKEESPSIHVIVSGSEQTIASREIDKIIATYTETELRSTVMEARVEERDKFILVRLPNHSLLYNFTIAQKYGNQYAWTILKSDISGDTPWRGRNGIFDPRISKWVYGDSIDNRIGTLDNTTCAQYGEQIESIFYSPILTLETFSINQMEIETITGFASEDVNVFMSLSYDGVTYNQEYLISQSEPLKYNKRFITRNLGYIANDFNFKFRVVSKGKTAFSGLKIDYD